MNASTSQPEEYDIVVLGSGAAGKLIAWTKAGEGRKVAVVERRYIGGSCPNIACLPSKNVVHSALVASHFRRGAEFGISAENVRIDMAAVRARKRKMVEELVDIHLDNYRKSGAELILGEGRFVGPKTIEVALNDGGARLLRGKDVVINTGTRATIEDVPGMREADPLTHIGVLELDHVPERLLILGGGYVGLEFAQAMRRFGSQVTILDRNDRLIHREDPDVSEGVEALFRCEGIDVITDARVTRVEGKSGEGVRLRIVRDGAESVLEGTHLLVAGGRTPNTDGIGLERTGVEVTGRGHIRVNERLETSAPGIWATGDCAGSPHFTHISENDFRIVSENMADGNRVTTGRQVPFCIFTDPEVARIGLSESEAKAAGVAYRLAKIPMEKAAFRPRTVSEMRGFLKALVDTKSDRILGFTAFSFDAGEIMATVQIVMLAGLPYTVLRDAILTHPTMAEALNYVFAAVPPRTS